jgi:antitoxin VapB
MSLNIKNEKTHRLIKQLARLTGENMTAAVETAVQERLERVRKKDDMEDWVQRILQIGRECAAHMKEPYKSIDHGELLYDEKGLPK